MKECPFRKFGPRPHEGILCLGSRCAWWSDHANDCSVSKIDRIRAYEGAQEKTENPENGHNAEGADKAIQTPITNVKKWFRNASDRDLAKLISEHIDCCVCKKIHGVEECPATYEVQCAELWFNWLQEEVQ